VLPRGVITQLVQGAWLPDGKRIVFTAIEEGRAARAYVQDVETGHMRPITPERVQMPEKAATPDGKAVLVWLDGKWSSIPLTAGNRASCRYLALTTTHNSGTLTDVSSTSRAGVETLFLLSGSSAWTSHRPARAVEDARPVRSRRDRISRSPRDQSRRTRVLLLVRSPPPGTVCRRGTEINVAGTRAGCPLLLPLRRRARTSRPLTPSLV
jgi:hypothetical protein